jgi:hypothetical protein
MADSDPQPVGHPSHDEVVFEDSDIVVKKWSDGTVSLVDKRDSITCIKSADSLKVDISKGGHVETQIHHNKTIYVFVPSTTTANVHNNLTFEELEMKGDEDASREPFWDLRVLVRQQLPSSDSE